MFSFLKAKFHWVMLLPMIFFPVLNSSLGGRYWQLNSGLLIPVQKNQVSSSSELLIPALSGDLDGDSLTDRMADAGFGSATRATADDVLARLKTGKK